MVELGLLKTILLKMRKSNGLSCHIAILSRLSNDGKHHECQLTRECGSRGVRAV
jgi:hypothetical protein